MRDEKSDAESADASDDTKKADNTDTNASDKTRSLRRIQFTMSQM